MKYLAGIGMALVAIISMSTAALASTYITVTASDSDPDAVRKVWDESGVTCIGVYGDLEFTIEVSESSPNSIDTCWIYIDGTTDTATTRDFTAEDYRTHYGCVVIKYDNDSYEDHEFRVFPCWEAEEQVTTGATAPANPIFPTDQTAADLIEDVADNDPDGLEDVEYFCACDGDCCSRMVATKAECRDKTDPDNCWADIDCW